MPSKCQNWRHAPLLPSGNFFKFKILRRKSIQHLQTLSSPPGSIFWPTTSVEDFCFTFPEAKLVIGTQGRALPIANYSSLKLVQHPPTAVPLLSSIYILELRIVILINNYCYFPGGRVFLGTPGKTPPNGPILHILLWFYTLVFNLG